MTIDEIIQAVSKNFSISISDFKKYNIIKILLTPYLDYLKEIGRVEVISEEGQLKYRVLGGEL